jgi:hypothetical protein
MAKSNALLAAAVKHPVGLALPDVLDQKVNGLLSIARDEFGKKYDRRDIVCALVFAGPRDKAGLGRLLNDYEKATEASVRLKGSAAGPGPRRPGRVPARKSSRP